MRNSVTAIAAIVVAATISTAAVAKEQYAFQGFGAAKCSEVNNNLMKFPKWREYYHTWAQGLISGLNFSSYEQSEGFADLNSMTTDDQEKVLIRYCRANPDKDFLHAVDELYGQLAKVEPSKDDENKSSNNKSSKSESF